MLYNEFQTEQERYLPKTGLFPEGRFSPKFMDFLETCKQIEMPKKNEVKNTHILIPEDESDMDQSMWSSPLSSMSAQISKKPILSALSPYSPSHSSFFRSSERSSKKIYPEDSGVRSFSSTCA